MRLFVAINFSAEVKAAIAQSRDYFKKYALKGNFTLDENLHLTLVFLDECDVRRTNEIKAILDKVHFSPFKLSFTKFARFKHPEGDIWWIGFKRNEAFINLEAEVSGRLLLDDFLREDIEYVPHITMGREIKLRPEFSLPEIPQIEFSVKSIELMKSERIKGKLTYTQVYSKSAD